MPFLINIIIGLVLSLASTLLQQAFAPKPTEQAKRTGTRGSAQIGGKVPQYFLVGTVGEAGKLEYQNAWGNDGEVPNAYLTSVYSFGDLPITAMPKLFVNGTEEAISGSGHVTQGYPSTGDKAGNLWAEFFDGTQVAASSYLTGKFGADADRPWLSDMIGVGVPYLITTALWSETLWTGFPSFVGEFQGIKLYDPRLDTTAGGSGSQRWATPSTWAFSDNSMVIIYNIERGIYYDGTRVWGGAATAAQLPYAVWAAAMDACDELVTLEAGGTEKRFRAGRRISLNERPADVIKELLIGANSRISHASDGTIYVLVGVPDEADGAFSDADVLATEPLGSIPFPNLDSIINGATATYREPSQAWEDKETAPYLRSDLETEDDGRQQLEGLDLGTTFSGTQAQRIIKAVIEEGRRFKTHVVALPPEFAQFRPLQVLAWTSDRFDYTAKLFLITARTRSPWGQVVFGLQEIDPADHDWTPGTDEQPLSFAPVVTNRPAPQEVSGFSVAPAIALDTAGLPRRPAIDVFWASASVTVDVRAVRITIRLAATDVIVWEGEAPRPELGEARITQGLLPDEGYEVQIQYVPHSGRVTVESSWLAVTTPDVRFGSLDIDLDAVSVEVMQQLEFVHTAARTALANLERIGSLLSEQDQANFEDKSILRRELVSKTGEIVAGYTEAIEVATGPMSAIGQKLERLFASQGGGTAEVNLFWTVSAGPTGYGARYGLTASVEEDEAYRAAALLLDVPTDPGDPTRVILDADQVVITSDGGASLAALFTAGTTYLASARIQDASIVAAKIADATITNAKIVDATITGAKIANATIGSAQIADAAITNAKIGTAVIQTANIVSGDVSATSASQNAGFISVSATDNVSSTVETLAVNAPIGKVIIFASCAVQPGSDTDPYFIYLRKNGTLVSTIYSGGGSALTQFDFVFVDTAPGSVTYTLCYECDGKTDADTVGYRSLVAINNKV